MQTEKYLSICVFIGLLLIASGGQNLESIDALADSNLNCNFETDYCRWENVALPPENKQTWKLSCSDEQEKPTITDSFKNLKNELGNNFIYSSFLNKSTSTALVSAPVEPHHLPVFIRFKSVFIGNPTLLLCQKIVFPPVLAAFRECKRFSTQSTSSLTTTDYVYQLPPTNYTTQVVIRAFCPEDGDSLGLASIHVTQSPLSRFRRSQERKGVQVITFDEWQRIRNASDQVPTVNVKPTVVLVVAKTVESSSEIPEKEQESAESATTETEISEDLTPTTTTAASSTNATPCTESFCVQKDSTEAPEALETPEKDKNETDNFQSEDEQTTKLITDNVLTKKSEDPKQALENLAQWVQILRNLAPILPVIPSLINSFKTSGDPPTSSAVAAFSPNGPYTDPTMAAGEQVFNWKNVVSNRRLAPVSTMAPVVQKSPQRHSHNNYEAPMREEPKLKSVQDINLSKLTIDELKTLESIHKKIFPINQQQQHELQRKNVRKLLPGDSRQRHSNGDKRKAVYTSRTSQMTTTAAPVIVYDKPKQVTKSGQPMGTDMSKAYRYLTPEMIREIDMLASLPDFGELIEGLDVSLLNKPGGFAVLKKQVFERLLTRLPLKSEDSDLLSSLTS